MLAQIFSITAPVILLALAGYCWARAKWPFDLEFITRLSLTFSVPCLIFATLVEAEIEPRAFRDLALASLAAYGAAGLVLWGLLRAAALDMRTWLAPTVFGNTGNVGLPVALYAFGTEGLAFAMVIFAVMAILSFTIGIYMVAGTGKPLEALKQPLVYASILGGAAAVTDFTPPVWAMETLKLAGQPAIPLMLLTLGVSIARLRVGDLGLATGITVVKLAITAAAGYAVALAFGLTGAALGALVLQLMMPSAVTSYLIAARYERDPDAVAGLVVISTLVSLAAIPGVLALLLTVPAP
ncbi:MAG: AEC family transporter [Pseudomonadota bacterium]